MLGNRMRGCFFKTGKGFADGGFPGGCVFSQHRVHGVTEMHRESAAFNINNNASCLIPHPPEINVVCQATNNSKAIRKSANPSSANRAQR